LLPEILGVHQQDFDVGGHRPLTELFQLRGGRRLPLPAHTGAADAVTLQALVDGAGIVAGGNLPDEFARDSLLHLSVLLEGPIALQGHLLALFASQPRLGHGDLPATVNDVSGLFAVAMSTLRSPGSTALLELLLHEPLNDG